MNKIIALSIPVTLVMVSLLFVNPAMAETTGWYYCNIEEIQTTSADGVPVVDVCISATNGDFTSKWVRLDEDYVKTGLATALTAVSTGSVVRVRLELNGGVVQIFRMRLINN